MRILFFRIIILLSIFGIAQGQEVNFTSSNLPIIVIDTHGQYIPDDYRIVADMGIIYNGAGNRNNLSDAFNNYNGKIAIEVRGSSSQMFPKKQYALETQLETGENNNVSLLEMPQENDWILYAPYSDKSLMRNVLAYKLANDIGRYATRTRFCELVLNDDYRGVYVLMEKIKRDDNRVNISTLNPDEVTGDDLTGGYIIKIDKWAGESIDGWESQYLPYPGSPYKIFYQYHYPKPDEIVEQQKNYIQDFIASFEAKMYSSEYADPVNGYSNYIDVPSFIDFFILNEIGKNVDGYRLSTFFYKDKESIDSKLYLGPIWDFNLAFGNADYYDGGTTNGWQVEINEHPNFSHDSFKVPFWWKKLLSHDQFINKLKCRWTTLRETVFYKDSLLYFVDAMQNYLQESSQRNFQRWQILGTYIWPNRFVGSTWNAEVSYLKTWIEIRLEWMDMNMPGVCAAGIIEDGDIIRNFNLEQNYPNPFNPTTVISWQVGSPVQVELSIYNVIGEKVCTLVSEKQPAGFHTVEWDASGMASGIYYYRLNAGEFQDVKKMIYIQ
jgi:hypothetical protein